MERHHVPEGRTPHLLSLTPSDHPRGPSKPTPTLFLPRDCAAMRGVPGPGVSPSLGPWPYNATEPGLTWVHLTGCWGQEKAQR